jgi:epidermal growth factor receptor substrate 15
LDITEFTIAMHLIQSFMSNLISTVPASLPPELFQAASIASPATSQFNQGTIRRTPSVSSTGSSRAPQVPPKVVQSPVRADFTGGSQMGIDGWDITPQDKTTFDDMFRKIDTTNKGYIDGSPLEDTTNCRE